MRPREPHKSSRIAPSTEGKALFGLHKIRGLRALQRSPFLLTYPLLLGGKRPPNNDQPADLHNRGGDSVPESPVKAHVSLPPQREKSFLVFTR